MNGRLITACVVLAVMACGVGLAADVAPLSIQGPKGLLTIDAKGISLAPSIASCPAISAQGGPAWVLSLQKEGAPPIEGSPVILTDQGQTVRTEATPQGVRLTYGSLTRDGKTWRIALTLAVQRQGDGFLWTGEITNNEPGWVVCGFTGPVLDSIQVDLATHPLLLPEGFGRRIAGVLPAKEKSATPDAGKHFELAWTYPSNRGTMQWCALAGAQAGLYVGCHDATHSAKSFGVHYTRDEKRLGLTLKHLGFCGPGKQWTLAPTMICPYEGSWHAAARYYRAWVDSASPLRDVPAWAKNASGWLLCILKQQNGEILWDYPSLAKLADVADQRGLDILGLFGWAHGGHDHLYPDYFPDPQMGGAEALRQALKEVHRRGKRAIIYANGQLEERDTEFWKTQGKDLAVIQKNGVSVQQKWHKFKNAPAYQFDLGCLAAQGWCDRMWSLALQANELGADGILYDQLGNTGPMPCYAAGHGHPVPSMVYAQDRRAFLRKIADHMKTVNPDFIVMTEGLHDSILDSISLFHGCVLGVFATAPAEIVKRDQEGLASAAYPELFRYTFPEVMSTVRIPTPMVNRAIANYTCTYGFRHEIESRYAPDVPYLKEDRVPQAAEYEQVLSKPDLAMMQATPPQQATRYLRQIVDFQRANADLLWHGRFVDGEGFTINGHGLVAKGFDAGDRLAVVVWNPGDQPASFTLNVPRADLVSAAEPEQGKVAPFGPLAAQTVRMLVWKKK